MHVGLGERQVASKQEHEIFIHIAAVVAKAVLFLPKYSPPESFTERKSISEIYRAL